MSCPACGSAVAGVGAGTVDHRRRYQLPLPQRPQARVVGGRVIGLRLGCDQLGARAGDGLSARSRTQLRQHLVALAGLGAGNFQLRAGAHRIQPQQHIASLDRLSFADPDLDETPRTLGGDVVLGRFDAAIARGDAGGKSGLSKAAPGIDATARRDLAKEMTVGTTRAASARVRIAAEIGCVTNTVRSPWLIDSARRKCASAIGPRISPMTQGATGNSQRRMMKPSAPNIASRARSKVEPLRL